MGHSHAGHTHGSGTAGGQHKGRLLGALALTLGFMGVEVVGGLVTDRGHVRRRALFRAVMALRMSVVVPIEGASGAPPG